MIACSKNATTNGHSNNWWMTKACDADTTFWKPNSPQSEKPVKMYSIINGTSNQPHNRAILIK